MLGSFPDLWIFEIFRSSGIVEVLNKELNSSSNISLWFFGSFIRNLLWIMSLPTMPGEDLAGVEVLAFSSTGSEMSLFIPLCSFFRKDCFTNPHSSCVRWWLYKKFTRYCSARIIADSDESTEYHSHCDSATII